MKRYVATSNKPPWQRKMEQHTQWYPGRPYPHTQKSLIWHIIQSAGADGIDRQGIVAKCAPVQALSADRVGFYISELKRAGFISVKGQLDATAMTFDEALLYAMTAFETALAKKLDDPKTTITDDMDRSWRQYQGCKARALAPTGVTDNEARVALKMALKKMLDLLV